MCRVHTTEYYLIKKTLKVPGVVVHHYNPSTQESEPGGLRVREFEASLSYIARPYFKKKKKKITIYPKP
jgi:hypothetical protein